MSTKHYVIVVLQTSKTIPTYVRAELALKLKPLIAKAAKDKEHERKTTLSNLTKSLPRYDTRKELARAAGVSDGTIHKVETIDRNAQEEVKAKAKAKK